MDNLSVTINEIHNSCFQGKSIFLMAGRKGLDNKVNQVSVMEVEDFTNFDLGENLLVLTTFSFCQSDESQLLPIITRLAEKNISGLIIKLNRFIENISSDIVDLANRCNLPIFIIDNDVNFRSIINHVYKLIVRKQYETIFQMNNMYKSLYNSLVTDITIENYIKQLDISSELEFYVETQCSMTYLSPALEHNSDSILYTFQKNCDPTIVDRSDFEEVLYQKENILRFPIKNTTTDFGFIVLRSTAEQLSLIEQMAFTQLASYLSIKLNELRISQKEKLTSNGRIYTELVDDNAATSLKVESLLYSAGFQYFDEYSVIFVSFFDQNLSYEKIDYLIDKYQHIFSTTSDKYFIGQTTTGFKIIYGLASEENDHTSDFLSFIKQLKTIFKKEEIPFKIGVSNPFNDLGKLSLAHYQAKNTILISRRVPTHVHSLFYKDVWEIDMITALVDSSQIQILDKEILQPLLDYDNCHQIKLMETLETVVLTESLKEASQELFLHITTLRYRLDKITAITGYSFQNNRGKIILSMAYFAYVLDLY